MYFYMATDKGNTFENLGLRQGRDQISSSKGEIYRRKKGQGWEKQSERDEERVSTTQWESREKEQLDTSWMYLRKEQKTMCTTGNKGNTPIQDNRKKNSHNIQTLQKQRMLWNFYFLGLSKVIWTCYNSPGTYSEWGMNAWLNWEWVCRQIDGQIYK